MALAQIKTIDMKEGDYKILIYYVGEEHPTIIERDSRDNAKKWVFNKRNINHFKNCDKWQIQDNKGNVLGKGGITTEIKVI